MKYIEKSQNVRVIKNEENPETPEVLAASLIKISDGFEQLSRSGGLNNEAIVCLLQNLIGVTKISKLEILLVITNLPRLKSYYIRR